jgi:hypothetical protein
LPNTMRDPISAPSVAIDERLIKFLLLFMTK